MSHRKREGRTEWSLLLGCILFLCSGGMIMISVKYPQFAQWYSDSVYSKIVEFFGRISGAFPFSIVEIGLYIGILTIFITGIFAVVQRKRGKISIFQWFSRVFLSAAILLFLYVSNCGIQYHKSSFSEQSKILVEAYSVEELEDTCVWLTEQVNQLTTKVSRTEKGTLELENTFLIAPSISEIEKDKEKKPAVIICPGGGYEAVCFSGEGTPIMHYMEAQGYRAFILKYRVAPAMYPAPHEDLALAIQYVRANAEEYGIDENDIMILGASAGGHLCSSFAALYEEAA